MGETYFAKGKKGLIRIPSEKIEELILSDRIGPKSPLKRSPEDPWKPAGEFAKLKPYLQLQDKSARTRPSSRQNRVRPADRLPERTSGEGRAAPHSPPG